MDFRKKNSFLKHVAHIVLVMMALQCQMCRSPQAIEQQHSFAEDSLLVESLLNKGDSLYARRSGFSTIEESMLYFDSAYHIAHRINDTLLLANTLFFIGNVYNAWNKEPHKTLTYYKQSSDLYNGLPAKKIKAFYLRYIIAHAYDGEKLNDSLHCVQTLQTAFRDLQMVPDSLRQKMFFLSDFAWVSTNIRNYTLAEKFLTELAPRNRIVNDPESNNYLDHYYLTRSRIDVYKYGRCQSPYLDSFATALAFCNNRFDSSYYSFNLSNLYASCDSYTKSYQYLKLNNSLTQELENNSVLSGLQKELLNRELQTRVEKELRTEEELKNKDLFLTISLLSLLIVGLSVFLYFIYRKRVSERKKVIRQQWFTHQLLQKEEEERKRIATDLHDGINHDLLALKNNILLGKPVDVTDVETITTSIREISRNLYPALFESIGLTGTVEALCERMTAAGLFTTCEIDYQSALTKKNELQLYRIVQEALTNVYKHAGAEAARITIRINADSFFTEIKDNGKGFDAGETFQAGKYFGLQSMQQRANVLAARFSIESTPAGTKIILTKN